MIFRKIRTYERLPFWPELKGELLGGIGDALAGYAGELGQFVLGGFGVADEIKDAPASGDQRVGNQGTVTAPGDCFGAHDRGRKFTRRHFQFFERGAEFGG